MSVATEQDGVGIFGGSGGASCESADQAGSDGTIRTTTRIGGAAGYRGTTKAWARHEAEKRAAALSEEEKEAEANQLLRKQPGDGQWLSRRAVSRRRAREILISQLEASGYSGTRRLLHSMAESLRLIDEEERTSLDEWAVRWEITRAIRSESKLEHCEKEALLGRLQGETFRETAERLDVSHERVRKSLGTALTKYYAGKLRRLESTSAVAVCFYEDASRRGYRRPNCCGQSPLCLAGATSKPCARCEHEKPNWMKDEDVRPGDLNYCPLAHLSRRQWGKR
jgi:hypothetical protein